MNSLGEPLSAEIAVFYPIFRSIYDFFLAVTIAVFGAAPFYIKKIFQILRSNLYLMYFCRCFNLAYPVITHTHYM